MQEVNKLEAGTLIERELFRSYSHRVPIMKITIRICDNRSRVFAVLGMLLVTVVSPASRADDAKTAVGGGVGAAAGAAIGQSVGGKSGAIVGGAVGGAAGAAVSTKGSGQTGAVVGGAVGGAAGTAAGQSVGGKTGAVVGAGVGGAAGATIGKNVGESAKPKAANVGTTSSTGRNFDDNDRNKSGKKHKKKKHKKEDRCHEEHPGKGHAYGKYKDCN